TFKDLLEHYPYRHVDKTQVSLISDIQPDTEFIQVRGRITSSGIVGERRSKRLVAELKDESGYLELVWFQGINWIEKSLKVGEVYLVYGRVSFYMGKPQISHPEIELFTPQQQGVRNFLEPVYPTTEKLKSKGLGGRQLGKLTRTLFDLLTEKDVPENLPAPLLKKMNFIPRFRALQQVHFPASFAEHSAALQRLKFEELFIAQIRLGLIRAERHRFSKGVVFSQVGELFNTFYNQYLPFELTGAQKRVLKDIRKDMGSGRQMNRLLQGDVGSGKTIVALLCLLLAADNGFQGCMMAPTEILAQQHYESLTSLLKDMPVTVQLLTGSTKAKERKQILESLKQGSTHILVGTHALIEEVVQFNNLGLAIVDEQHRFGVAQRAKLWTKAVVPPHMLVMTATPIPRTLAMTAYGDLDYSIMDELPPNRTPITTVHRTEQSRPQVMDFIKAEIAKGRQAYIIFPLIEESEKMDYENLMKGYENVKAFFPEPKYWISMVHGRQKTEVKETNMQRFVQNDTQIMVATTVIEVGVNVPNATIMVIESAEKFGLSQLHQLRGRVGRGRHKSFCILLTATGLNKEARERLQTMCATSDGFKIAEKDLELRGPGDIEGTRQSGMLNFKLASIVQDKDLLQAAHEWSGRILETDPDLSTTENIPLKHHLRSLHGKTAWSKIS
ncbi:MAG TPA: ATP-dependent DNA helicase RecG, partial [Chitinophagaceae bacterium]|nr:ATP-dependent DNA helicase RecG [Chitinophagaceae bacterium]